MVCSQVVFQIFLQPRFHMQISFSVQPDRDRVLVDASRRPTWAVQGNYPRIDASRVQVPANNRSEIRLLLYASGSGAYLRRITQRWFVLQVVRFTSERDDVAAGEHPIHRPFLLDSAPCEDRFSVSSTGLHTYSSQRMLAKCRASEMAWYFLIFLVSAVILNQVRFSFISPEHFPFSYFL